MKTLYLIYINYVGKDYKGNYIYEFLFSDTTKKIDGDEWDTFPASGRPQPPHEMYIKHVGKLESGLNLDVVQNSDTFAVWDAIDGVIALAWEKFDFDAENERLTFKFGESMDNVTKKLKQRDFELIKEEVNFKEI